ncbi:ubiquitin-like small modifier protein 1 [Methanolobus profundi]|uniref:Molybdopterin synthase sulfur carrier subunit n=1 Tax=Methanolobus profundi TaxID=487685 RepID=A0A1I4NV12_9EURY|nr:ubiquitin-like small modifier protein 1 [Methanolobus profundi]SFM19361.1 molybdopterin synthase sulfur carrier subunit [Methanolobus profundi]
MVFIKFSSALNSVTGTRATTVNIGDSTVKGLFDRLSSEYGKEFETRLMDGGEIRRFVNVYVNGEDIRHLSGIETKITDRDEVSVLPAISGG